MAIFTPFFGFAAAGRMALPLNGIRAVWFMPILLGKAYDLFKRHRVHPVHVIGLAVLFVSSFRDGLMNTASWLAFTRWIGTFLV